MHVYLIGKYSKSIRQHHPGGDIIKTNFSLTCMTIIDPTKGWFEIIDIPMYNPDEVTGGKYEYMDKSSYKVIQLFKNTLLRDHDPLR